MSSIKRPALGRGLSALLEDSATDVTTKSAVTESNRVAGSIGNIPVDQIEANPFQPRTFFEEEALQELAESIKLHGLIQPVTVRKMGYDKYQLISGERRFKASQLAGLTEIPAYIRIANDQAMLEMALVENIQRENLDAMEVAISFQRLIDECNLTQEGLSEKVGKKRSTVTNYLRLLKLPVEIQMAIRKGKLSMGHARAIISIENPDVQMELAIKTIEEGLSVRQIEELARENGVISTKKKKEKAQEEPVSLAYQQYKWDLASALKAKVDLQVGSTGKGKIVINFTTEEELERLMSVLRK